MTCGFRECPKDGRKLVLRSAPRAQVLSALRCMAWGFSGFRFFGGLGGFKGFRF